MTALDPERIASAALRIARGEGIKGFTMRAVAEELGVTPMALYHHVQGKAELAALVIDAAIRTQPLPSPTGDWQDDLWEMARWIRESMLRDPVIGHLRLEYRVLTPTMLRVTERWFGLWLQSGLALEQAMLAARTSITSIAGVAAEELSLSRTKRPGRAELAQLPNVRLLARAPRDRDAQFELVARSLIEGLQARLSSRAGGLPCPPSPRS